jgi:hypothetical protein
LAQVIFEDIPMTLLGHIEDGKVILDQSATVPNGTAVVCHVISKPRRPLHPDILRLTGIADPGITPAEAHLEWLEKKSGSCCGGVSDPATLTTARSPLGYS